MICGLDPAILKQDAFRRSAAEIYLRLSLEPTSIGVMSTTSTAANTGLMAAAVKGAGPDAVLELADGTTYAGMSFGAPSSVAGECVFQTGEHSARLFSTC